MKNSLYALFFTSLAAFPASQLFCSESSRLSPEQLKLFASTNTYKGQEITPGNIRQLMPQKSPKVSNFIRSWLERHEDLAKVMSGAEAFTGDNPVITQDAQGRGEYFKQTQERIEQEGFKNLSSSSNTVIEIDDLVVKAGSIPNRHKNLDAEFGKEYGDQITAAELEDFNQNRGGRTFQTISRAATYLRGIEAKELFNLDCTTFTETDLVNIPGRPEEVADTNYVTVEKKVKPVADLQNHALALDEEIMRQSLILIAYTGLWNMVGSGGNIFVVKDPETGKLIACHHDLEQPNFHRKPSKFLNNDVDKYVANIQHGWGTYGSQIIQPYAEKVEKNIDYTDMPEDQKELLKQLLRDRVATLLKTKAAIEAELSEHLPK